MADNVAITQGSGTTVRTDELAGGIQVQVVKIALGADGAEDNLVDAGQQLMAASVPVAIASNQSAIPVTDNSTTLSIDDGGGAITVDGTVAVTNAGITTIAGAVAGTEMQVDVLTMPTVTVNAHAVTNAGTFAVQVDGAALTALQLIDNMISGNEAQVDVITLPAIPAGTNNIGDVDVLTIAAGENHLGEVGGNTILATFTLSLDTSAYAAGDVLADTQVINSVFRKNDGTGVLQSIKLVDKDDQGQALDLVFLNANNSLGTENSAPNISDANADAILGIIPVAAADFIDLGGCRVATITNIGLPLQAVSGAATLYIGAISRGTGTYSASGITGILGILRD
jgi:hypothetical protein